VNGTLAREKYLSVLANQVLHRSTPCQSRGIPLSLGTFRIGNLPHEIGNCKGEVPDYPDYLCCLQYPASQGRETSFSWQALAQKSERVGINFCYKELGKLVDQKRHGCL
jgi:hypothetical protein